MKTAILKAAALLAARMGHIFVATVGADGTPHLAAAAKVALDGELVEVSAWFCPTTVVNLRNNRAISLVVWEPGTDQGYQLLGQAERVEEVAMMDGFLPGPEEAQPLPQVERKLVVRVDHILDFHRAPHSDLERS
jgi:hypothetical protein